MTFLPLAAADGGSLRTRIALFLPVEPSVGIAGSGAVSGIMLPVTVAAGGGGSCSSTESGSNAWRYQWILRRGEDARYARVKTAIIHAHNFE